MPQVKGDVSALGDRVNHVEFKMGEFAGAYNKFADANNDADEELRTLKLKLADLEDQSCRNNITFCGVSETVRASDLQRYVQQMRSTLLPDPPDREVVVDRAHRLQKHLFLPDNIPRDVIAKIHFYYLKGKLMQFARKIPLC